ncbi:NUDIX hydrolase [bacterium]|nr:NUDIX hydrolase [bacterium]MBU1614525.1 NUDIX hydrolase [bacterium]
MVLKQGTYLGNNGEKIKWETIERRHQPTGLVIIPRLIPSNRYVLIRQYRPPISNYIIGFPAGLFEGDDIREEALRELKEETGYTGKITGISPILKTCTGVMDQSSRIINVDIDETDPQNLNPEQSLEPSEEIEVIVKREDEIREFLGQEQEKGYAIGAGLWYLFGINKSVTNIIRGAIKDEEGYLY